ncbi:MAG: nucleotidyltransferase [Clostridiales bacterium]|nr:nucleotidyltransferase [Clostridiales bacterium]
MPVQPILVIMAAGMGSRYGGLKQMDPVGPDGEFILDYSLFDARRAGFSRAVLVIKRENEEDFRRLLCDRARFPITFAYQDLTDLPRGYAVPLERKKPWGTGHAVLAARDQIDAPFCVINADDYYGARAFDIACAHLSGIRDDGDYCMVGYLLRNTLSETGYVARGVCEVTPDGTLVDIVERTHIISTVDGPLMSEDLRTYRRLDPDTIVSMNMWGFPRAMIDRLSEAFPAFLNRALQEDPAKAEFFLPYAVDGLLREDRARVTVTTTEDRWYGVTYREDRARVVEALRCLTDKGRYPRPLWRE